MVIVVDVGNTNIVMAAYKDDNQVAKFRMSSNPMRTTQETSAFLGILFDRHGINPREIDAVIISTVIPKMKTYLSSVFSDFCDIKTMFVDYTMDLSISLPTGEDKRPQDIGTDRIVNGVAAYDEYGGPVIIIDYGTANKYDVIDESGEFVAGVTAPGMGVRANGLFDAAALLSEVEIKRPDGLVTVETTHSVQAGIVYGVIGETEYMVKHLSRELDLENPTVVATGGFSPVVKGATDVIDHYDSDLTLQGLLNIHHMNK